VLIWVEPPDAREKEDSMTFRMTRAVSGFALVSVAAMLVVASAGTALAQYYPPPPPPPTYYAPPPPPPPPPPSYYAPPPPAYPYTPPPLPPPDLEQNDIRLQAGITGISSGYYCASGYYGSSCSVAFSYWELDLRAAWEIRAKNSPGALTLGFDVLPATNSYSNQQVIYEPTMDFGVSATNRRSKVRTRGYLGLGIPITSIVSSNIGGVQTASGTAVGAVARFGGGISAPLAPHFAFGLDIVLSLGGINGYFISMLNFAVGPEITF
jgi:hypothetical protein